MTKPYNNNAVIGNGSILGCIGKKGELLRLFGPHIDYPQHIGSFNLGLCVPDQENTTIWLEDDQWECTQKYINETNILNTKFENNSYSISINDFSIMDKDIIVRKIKIINTEDIEKRIGVLIHSKGIQTSRNLLSSLFDFDMDGIIHYRHGYYWGYTLDFEINGFQLGNDSYEMASKGILGGFDDIGMVADGAIFSNLGSLKGGEGIEFTIYIGISDNLKGLKKELISIKKLDSQKLFEENSGFWSDYLKRCIIPEINDKKIELIYKRSILIFSLMVDKKSGGILASPEIDEEFSKSGRYAYCWGRDAAFITEAMDQVGLYKEVDLFYDWAVKAQNENGSWYQRYYMDGNLGPSWGLQIDETGTLIFGIYKHYKITKDKKFLEKMWLSIEKACNFIINFKDIETNLPMPSYDLWEERLGEHAYSSSAVYGGLVAASEISRILGYKENENKYTKEANSLKKAIEKEFWNKKDKYFMRSIRVKMNPWGMDPSKDKAYLKVNEKGYYRDFTKEDKTVDISLLGLAIPFNVMDVTENKFKDTVEKIVKKLSDKKVGGIRRYENDDYIGGNPWIITTLWLSIYYIKIKEYDNAKKLIEWSRDGITKLGLLPEQISKESGEPIWVIPLTWSHAMFVIAVKMYIETGEIL